MNQIEKYVLQQIGENLTSPDVFIEGSEDMDFLRRSINAGITDVCIATGCFKTTYFLVLRADRMYYRFRQTRDEMLYPVEVLDRTNGRRLYQTSFAEVSDLDPFFMQHAGFPTHYWQVSHDAIGIYRKPSDTGRILEIRCVSVPKDYVDDTTPPKVRDQFEKAISHYALSEYFASRGDAKRATENMMVYLDLAGLQRFMPDHNVMPLPQKGGNYAFARQ